MAQLTPDVIDARFEKKDHESVISWLLRTNTLMQELLDNGTRVPPDEIVGRVVSFAVADGHAHYQVMSETPLRLRHLPHGEGYQIGTRRMQALTAADLYGLAAGEVDLTGVSLTGDSVRAAETV